MAMLTQNALDPKTRSCSHSFNGKGKDKKVTCQVTASSIHITIKKNGAMVHNNDYGVNMQGYSDFLDTNVDDATWDVKVTGNALCTFTLTAPD
jgi:hypothetical protein